MYNQLERKRGNKKKIQFLTPSSHQKCAHFYVADARTALKQSVTP